MVDNTLEDKSLAVGQNNAVWRHAYRIDGLGFASMRGWTRQDAHYAAMEIVALRNLTTWLIGDFLNECRDSFDDFDLSEWAPVFRRTQEQLRKYMWVAEGVPRENRIIHGDVAWSHHRAVAGVVDKAQQKRLLQMAESRGWTRDELRDAMEQMAAELGLEINELSGVDSTWRPALPDPTPSIVLPDDREIPGLAAKMWARRREEWRVWMTPQEYGIMQRLFETVLTSG